MSSRPWNNLKLPVIFKAPVSPSELAGITTLSSVKKALTGVTPSIALVKVIIFVIVTPA